MPQDKLETAIREVVKNNNYSKEQEIQFRKFMKELIDQYNQDNKIIESKADNMIKRMTEGEDVLGEGEKEEAKPKNMGFTAPWILGLVSGLFVAAMTIGLIFITR